VKQPDLITTSLPGSFAHYTMTHRLPAIVDRVLQDMPYPEDIRQELLALRQEVATGEPVRPLADEAPDRPEWDAMWEPVRGRTWHGIPWYYAEAYFYRRLLEAAGYFRPGPFGGVDPFETQKRRELSDEALDRCHRALAALPAEPSTRLATLILYSLWGNRADLTFEAMSATAYAGLDGQHEDALLIDDRPQIVPALAGAGRVDLIADNSGLELLFDLALADELLATESRRQSRLHLKSQPFYVSDATVPDVEYTLAVVAAHAGLEPVAQRLREQRDAGHLILAAEPFWVTARPLTEMQASLREDLAEADMVLIKGDANYRRLIEDRAWPVTASLAALTRYFPAPFAAIRTVKSELALDMTERQAAELSAAHPDWMASGHYGVIQHVPGTGK